MTGPYVVCGTCGSPRTMEQWLEDYFCENKGETIIVQKEILPLDCGRPNLNLTSRYR